MNDRDSGGKDDEIIEKLGDIDEWLNTIVHVKDEPVLKTDPLPNPSKNPAGTSSQQNPLPKPLKILPNKPLQKMQFSQKSQKLPFHKRFSQKAPTRQDQGVQGEPRAPAAQVGQRLRIIPLGGFEEVGKNMLLFEYDNDIVIVDMGFQFPTEDMLGIDYVLPDITYLLERKHKIRGVFLTHGHLDHIGAIPYLLPKLGFPPVYGAPLTLGFVEKQLVEFDLKNKARLIKFDPSERIRAGIFDVSFFRVNHSIPDAVAIVLDTPCGRIVHTGDFKFDFTPADQRPADFQEIALVGRKGVAVLISDSTNAIEPGHTVTEKIIAQNLDDLIRQAKGRLIITAFSSLIGRLQQVMDSAVKYKRRIFLTGRSMEMNIRIAQNLGYIKVPKGLIGDVRKMGKIQDEQVIILTTGSQGEDVSGLARMATETHAKVKIQPGDTVVLSASPIVGNEAAVVKVINGLCRLGAKVITNRDINIHTSGHAKQEDLKLMIKLLKPQCFIPAHGDLYMRMAHRELAWETGISPQAVFLLDNGEVVEGIAQGKFLKTKDKVPAGYIMVEGPERSEVAGHILMDRQLMAENGALTVVLHVDKASYRLKMPPSIESRGFVYLDLSEKVVEEVTKASQSAFEHYVNTHRGVVDKKGLVEYLQHSVDRLLVRLLDKRPLVIPVVVYN